LFTKFSEFQVSDGFLIKSYNTRDANAIPFGEDGPAGDSEDTQAPSRDLTSVYLVEPRRASSAVLKFSGTLGAPNRQDKRSATVAAFSHFVVEDTACQYMFADIQGSHFFYFMSHSYCLLIILTLRINGS
jgi:hypothetical protein